MVSIIPKLISMKAGYPLYQKFLTVVKAAVLPTSSYCEGMSEGCLKADKDREERAMQGRLGD
jgi:hypothetical protein